jgi:YbbR domain-containing protein
VGLTEQSDAMVIVVSEERGEVIVAKNSDIIPIRDNLALKRQLGTHLGIVSEIDEAHSRRESMELGVAAAVCFLCMAGVWFSFARGLETLTSLEVPLEYVNRDSRMQILSASENTVRLHLSGSGALISSMKPDQVKVQLDLDNAINGENVFTINHDNIAMPPGVRLNRIEPSEVKVVLDFPITKEIPIQVDWVGALPEGLILKNVRLKPDAVPVTGVGKILNKISTLYTEKVQMENLQSSGQITVGLALSPASLKLASGFKDKVEISYILGKREG